MKKLFVALACCLLPLALLVGGGWFFLKSSVPENSGSVALPGLQEEVRVYRDAAGVPHIFAKHKSDAFRMLGFLHATDRPFQMEMMRRAGAGRLAEVLGKDLVSYDKRMRTLGFSRLVEANFRALSPNARQVLQDYASGVNAALEQNALVPEFRLLGIKPERWRPEDSLYWAKLMAWQLSGNMEEEVFRAAYAEGDLEKAKTLYFSGDGQLLTLIGSPVTVQPEGRRDDREEGTQGRNKGADIDIVLPLSFVPASPRPFARQASNAYVLSGARTASGKPILANDPHLELNAPVLWYLARIITPGWEVKGATVPGVPFFPLGQNLGTAWGFTTSGIDAQDIVFIPEKSGFITARMEIIPVKGGDPVTVEIRETPHGPVVSDAMREVTAVTPAGTAAVLQFTGLRADDRTVEALYRINMAADAGEIESATQLYTAPPQNLFYADRAGRSGFIAVGISPQRAEPLSGFMPQTDAGDGGFFWKEDLPNARWPRRADPPSGFLLNANNAPVSAETCAEFSCGLGFDWAEPYRALRLTELLESAQGWDVRSAAVPMLDIVSDATVAIAPLLIQAAAQSGEKEVLNFLQAWPATMDRSRPEPLIYAAWFAWFLEKLYPGITAAGAQWPKARLVEVHLRKALTEKPDSEIRKEIERQAIESLAEALGDLRTRFGVDWHHWRWGAAHKAPLENLLWGKIPVLGPLLSLETESDGDAYTLRRGASLHREGAATFLNEHGAGYRAVYDLGNPENSLFMIATGESGHVLSPHYGDLVNLWARGAFITISGDENEMRGKQSPLLTARPR